MLFVGVVLEASPVQIAEEIGKHALHQRGCILMQKTIDGLALMDERWFGMKENMPKFSASECEMAAKGHLFYTSWKFNPLKTLTGLPRSTFQC